MSGQGRMEMFGLERTKPNQMLRMGFGSPNKGEGPNLLLSPVHRSKLTWVGRGEFLYLARFRCWVKKWEANNPSL